MARDALILTHGAGGNRDSRILLAVDAIFAEAGYLVERINLPFRELRPKGPPRVNEAVRNREALHQAVAALSQRVSGRILLGGQSYGGRQASILASGHPRLVDGLLLLSYPLHAPGKPGSLRTGHFPDLQTPALFVIGTKDPFGSPAELDEARKAIPARNDAVVVAGAGHDLKKGNGWDLAPLVSFFGEDQPAHE